MRSVSWLFHLYLRGLLTVPRVEEEELRAVLGTVLSMTMDAHARHLADVVKLLCSSLSELLSYGDAKWVTVPCR